MSSRVSAVLRVFKTDRPSRDQSVRRSRTGHGASRWLSPLSSIYEWTGSRGFTALGEHVIIHDVPVQFLPAHNALVQDSVTAARELDYEGVTVRVVAPEH